MELNLGRTPIFPQKLAARPSLILALTPVCIHPAARPDNGLQVLGGDASARQRGRRARAQPTKSLCWARGSDGIYRAALRGAAVMVLR